MGARGGGRRLTEEQELTNSNTVKYISLFPREETGKEDKDKLKLPKHLQGKLSDDMHESDRTRLAMLLETRELMDAGKLSATPETEREWRQVELACVANAGTEGGKKRKATKDEAKEETKDEADDFFDSD